MSVLSLVRSGFGLSESWKKTIKLSIISFVLLFSYSYLFAVKAHDYEFLLVGGIIGFASAGLVVINCLLRRDSQGHWPPQISLIFWRALCEAGIGFRFVLQPAFNLYICHAFQCTRETGVSERCAFPSFMWEFFILASEFWFLCNGLDLYYSITNPFFSFNKRLMYYHIFCWTGALLVASSPFWLVPKWQEIYGFWFINPHIDDTANCWIKITWNNYAWPIWVYFFVPLMVIYCIVLLCLVTAYLRLRRGVTRSFLPRMRLLIMNTVNVVVHMLYWAVFVLFYAWTFWTRIQFKSGYIQPTNNIIYFVIGSKGCSCLLVWILTANNSQLGLATATKKSDGEDAEDVVTESVDANTALRQEVLSFATAGIRSSARAGAKATPDRKAITRRPQQYSHADSEAFERLINPMFFVRFILGYTDDLKALEDLVANKRRSVNETFMRQTVTMAPPRVRGTHGGSSSTATSIDVPLSQRPTVVSGTDGSHHPSIRPSFLASAFSYFSRGSAMDPRLSSLDRNLQSDNLDPEGGMEMAGRRSSSMVETDKEVEATQSTELFDLASKKARFWRSVYDFFMDTSESVEFTEFEPYHFRRVRLAGGITDNLYAMYFATTIKERLTQGGASGAFFFFSKGEKFIAKSCSGEELDTLTHNAQAYADYMEANPDSCISRIYGAYRLQIYGNALHFFVMNNIFLNAEGLAMNEKYDIKGSWVARNATPPINNMTVTCTHCEQKYVYTTRKKGSGRRARRDLRDTRPVSTDKGSEPSSSNPLAGLTDLGTLSTTASPLAMANYRQSPVGQPQTPTRPLSQSRPLSAARGMSRSGEYESDDLTEVRAVCPYTVSGEHEPSVILKDNDIKYKIRLPRHTTENLLHQIRADADFLLSIGVMDYSLLVGVHNTEYEVMAEDPGSTIHTLVKSSSSSFTSSIGGDSSSPGGSSRGKVYLRPSTTSSVGVADTKRPFADSAEGSRGSATSTMTGSSHSSAEQGDDASRDSRWAGAGHTPARGMPSANTTASAYLSAAVKSGLTEDVAPSARPATGTVPHAFGSHGKGADGPTPATGAGTRSSTGVARLSRLSLGIEGNSFASDSVAHSQDTETSGDLGYARKLEVYRVVGPDAYFMGIIDFQQKWTIQKRLERFFKLNLYGYDPDGLSAIEPVQYRDRFLRKVEDILTSDYAHQSRFAPAGPPGTLHPV